MTPRTTIAAIVLAVIIGPIFYVFARTRALESGFAQISVGDTALQVRKAMGPPVREERANPKLDAEIEYRYWVWPVPTVWVVGLSGDKVVAKSDAASTVERGQKGATSAAASAPTDSWIGRWKGPEATFLEISGGKGSYEIEIMDLDRARTFHGATAGDHIEFQRDGTNESLKPSSGDATGMKWLAGKIDCLTIKAGEGFCRD